MAFTEAQDSTRLLLPLALWEDGKFILQIYSLCLNFRVILVKAEAYILIILF